MGGWTLLGLAMVIAGALLGAPGLLLIGGLTLLSRWLTTLWSRYGLDSIGYERRIATNRAVWGDQVPLDVEVWNRKLLPVPLLTADDHVTDTLRVAGKHAGRQRAAGPGSPPELVVVALVRARRPAPGHRRAAARRVHVRPDPPHRQRPLRTRNEQRGARAAGGAHRPAADRAGSRAARRTGAARDRTQPRKPVHRSVPVRRRPTL